MTEGLDALHQLGQVGSSLCKKWYLGKYYTNLINRAVTFIFLVKPQLAADSRSEKEKSIFTHLTFAITTISIFDILLQVLNMNEIIRNDKQGKKKINVFSYKSFDSTGWLFFSDQYSNAIQDDPKA